MKIGKPINHPQALDIKLKGKNPDDKAIQLLAEEMLESMPDMWKRIIDRGYEIS